MKDFILSALITTGLGMCAMGILVSAYASMKIIVPSAATELSVGALKNIITLSDPQATFYVATDCSGRVLTDEQLAAGVHMVHGSRTVASAGLLDHLSASAKTRIMLKKNADLARYLLEQKRVDQRVAPKYEKILLSFVLNDGNRYFLVDPFPAANQQEAGSQANTAAAIADKWA
jgi:hypothetical protein